MKLRITIDGKSYEADVEILEDEETGPEYPAYVPPPIAYPAIPVIGTLPQGNSSAPGETVCRSPVTGLVIRVLVAPGQQVEANELLMVLEAMKMETQVKSHRAGTVKSVQAAVGKPVKLHQVLVEFE